MSFREKLIKLRKEKQITQEQLAEMLNVSRQAVSKWESDMSYPETEKIIEISKIFNCSIDYLLKDDGVMQDGSQIKTEFHQKHEFQVSAWSIGYLVVSLVIYAFPYAPFYMGNDIIYGNVYHILGGFYEIGNVIIFLAFLSMLIHVTLGTVIYFKPEAKLYKYRRRVSILESVLWSLMLAFILKGFSVGMIMMVLLSVGNVICSYKLKMLKPKVK